MNSSFITLRPEDTLVNIAISVMRITGPINNRDPLKGFGTEELKLIPGELDNKGNHEYTYNIY